jgi:predicted nucleic acid-binding protein
VRRYWLDTSLILRLLTGQPDNLAEKALEVFQKAEQGAYVLRTHPLVVAEAFYTLTSFYRVSKGEAALALLELLDREGVELLDEEAVRQALNEAARGGLSFVDAFLLSCSQASGEGLASLDGKLRKRTPKRLPS